jgi:hypothetical protein
MRSLASGAGHGAQLFDASPYTTRENDLISLDLATPVDATRLLERRARAQEKHPRGLGGGRLRGLTECRVGVELMADRAQRGINEVSKGSPNRVVCAREFDRGGRAEAHQLRIRRGFSSLISRTSSSETPSARSRSKNPVNTTS